MFYLDLQSNNPFFNLACEEYLFNAFEEEFLILYRNEKSIIVGKHQNTVAEADLIFAWENKIPVLRRYSGGGTVFHDIGNVNFSFISSGKNTEMIDFKRFAGPVVDFLNDLGVKANLSDRNDIFIGDRKVSGNAAHARGRRALHHGTLLFDSDLELLSAGLHKKNEKFVSRAVKSTHSPVTNIKTHLKRETEVHDFIFQLADFLKSEFRIQNEFILSEEHATKVNELAHAKYAKFEWNFGKSPDYSFDVMVKAKGGIFQFKVSVSEGRIRDINFQKCRSLEPQLSKLIGVRHCFEDIGNALTDIFDESETKTLTQSFFR